MNEIARTVREWEKHSVESLAILLTAALETKHFLESQLKAVTIRAERAETMLKRSAELALKGG